VFHYDHMTLTQIGQLFGVSSHQIGKWLVEPGLRTSKNRPSSMAHENGFVMQGPSRGGTGYIWVRHSEKTVAALQAKGHQRIPNPPPWLVDAPRLCGPFEKRANDQNSIDVVNDDGSVCLVVTGEANAAVLVKVLNAAHKSGYLDRHIGMPDVGAAADHLAT
jgi:hypothetical protein